MAWLSGSVVSLGIISGLAVLSGVTLSHERAAAVIEYALQHDKLSATSHPGGDTFTECAMMETQMLRPPGAIWQALDTKLRLPPREHPCDTLHTMMFGTPAQIAAAPQVSSYVSYPQGSRHLEALVFSVINYSKAVILYDALSYGSLALLLAAMVWRDRKTALVLAPVPIVLALAFSLHIFGGNLAHAPGFFAGWLMLALLVAAKPWFEPPYRRAALIAAAGVVTTYFDLLSGSIPTILALAIVLNHFYFVADTRQQPAYFMRAMGTGIAIAASFVATNVMVNLPRLWLLAASGVETGNFRGGLLSRMSDLAGEMPVSFAMNVAALFAQRHQMTPGGEPLASWVLITGALCWAGVLASAAIKRLPDPAGTLVLAAAAAGPIAWYVVFPSHTYIHAWFMVRLLALPCAFGMAAAMLTAKGWCVAPRPVRQNAKTKARSI